MLLALLLLALMAASPASSRLGVGDSVDARQRALSAAAVGACAHSFPSGRPVAVVSTVAHRDESTLGLLHAQARWPVLLARSASAHAVLLVAHSHDVARLRDSLRAQPSWSARARFVLALSDDVDEARVRAQRALEAMWAVGAAHVVVVTWPTLAPTGGDVGKLLELYTWRPFGRGRCADRVVAELTDRWEVVSARLVLGAELFPTKVPHRLGGCVLTASTFDWPPFVMVRNESGKTPSFRGLEISLLNTLAEACDFELRYVTTPKVLWGAELADGSWTGATGELFHGRANLSVASYIDQESRHRAFDVSSPYLTNGVVWIVPRAGRTPRWLSLAKVFSPSFWALVVATWAIAAILLRLLASTSTRVHHVYSSLASCMSNALAVLLGMSVARQPTTDAMRLFFMLWCFYCLQINTAYQSTLISVLTEPTYQKQVTDMEELVTSRLHLASFLDYTRYLDDEVPLERQVKARVATVCQDHERCLRRVASGEEFALLADSAYSNFLVPSLSVGLPRVVPFSAQVFSYMVGMLLPKGGLLTSRFNEVIQRINQAGLMSKWRHDVTLLAAEHSRIEPSGAEGPKKSSSSASGPVRLTLSHLQGAYIVLAAGLSTASLALLAELLAATVRR